MIEVRTGNRAKCQKCSKHILYDEQRVVETPCDNSWPQHYHIECYKEHANQVIEVLVALLDPEAVKHGPKYEESKLREVVEAEYRRIHKDRIR